MLDSRLLDRAQLEDFSARAEVSDEGLYTLLMKEAAVHEDELRRAAAHVLGVPFVLLAHEDIEPEALELVPEPLARTHSLATFARSGPVVDVLLLDLDSLEHIKFLEEEQQLSLVPHLTDRVSFKRALLIYQKRLKEKYGDRLKSVEDERATDALLSHALLSRAHEIHLEPRLAPGGQELRVRYRTGSMLYDAMSLPKQTANIVGRLKELANLSFTLPVPQEGRFKVMLQNGEHVRVRVATLPAHSGEKITLHLAREAAGKKGFTLSSLGLHGQGLDDVHDALTKKSGLVLVAAPRGGGKTTTLYTLLDSLASPYLSLASVEEKIEVPLAHVTQTQIKKELGLTYASALRATLRQKPDVVMIGEIASEDVAGLAASAASRGTLVLAGIDASSAKEAIEKMISLGVPERLLNAVLSIVIGQRVVKKVCVKCKEEYTLSRAEAAPLERDADFGRVLASLKAEGVVEESKQWKEMLFTRGIGCSSCEGGYTGLVGLQEVAGKDGEAPLSIVEDGLFKAAQGLTSIEEVKSLYF